MDKSSKNKNRKKSLNKCLYKAGFFVFLAFFVLIVVIIAIGNGKKKAQEKKLKELAEQSKEQSAEQSTDGDVDTNTDADLNLQSDGDSAHSDSRIKISCKIPSKNIDWDKLEGENKDIYAWIYIPNTNVDYPVLQSSKDTNYYLTHNIDNSEGHPGCIYSQNINSKDFLDPNTVLYGHNMRDGSMFNTLHNFESGEFFENNQYIYIYTRNKNYVYKIFAAYTFSDADILTSFDFNTPECFQQYLDGILSIRDMSSHIRKDMTITSDNHILTLSTCTNGTPHNRYLVQGVLINDPTFTDK